jgi:hypothetical protein
MDKNLIETLKYPSLVALIVIVLFKLIAIDLFAVVFVVVIGVSMLYLGAVSKRQDNSLKKAAISLAAYGAVIATFSWLIDTIRLLLGLTAHSNYTALEWISGLVIMVIVFAIGSIIVGLFGFMFGDLILKKK